MRKMIFFAILILFMLSTRFFDFFLVWNLNRLEFCRDLKGLNKEAGIHIVFLGFSSELKAEKKLKKIADEKTDRMIMVNYFNFTSPSVFLIENSGEEEDIVFPWNGVSIENGYTKIKYFKFDIMKKIHDGNISYKSIPMAGSLWDGLGLIHDKESIKSGKSENEFKIAFNSGTDFFFISKYVGKLNIFYFFLPLLTISFLGFCRSEKYFICSFYFPIMILLFFNPTFWANPYLLAKSVLDFEFLSISGILFLLINLAIYFFISFMILTGIKKFSFKNSSTFEKLTFFYFVLLPIVLRF